MSSILKGLQLNELSTNKLAQYKTAAAADAKKADSESDYKRGDKRFSGIVKATKKQFANDEKKEVAEGYGRNSYAYRQDGGANDERHDLDPSDWYFVKDGKMFAISVYPRQEQEAIERGYSRTRAEAKAKAGQQGMTEDLDENLHKWFKEKWVRFGPDGKIRGDCARGDDSEGKPKCLPQSKAHSLGKKGRASAASRKRREDPNPERSGKAINVNTKKTNEEQLDELSCWSGYHRVAGTKAGFPGSCAKNKTNESEHSESCPHCGGEMVSEELMNEKKDACYYKVKSRYKVWPSAYASGALVKCRKKGASNWGNGGKSNESVAEDDAGDVEQRMIAKIEKEKQRLAKLKQTDPEAYKREMEKSKTSSRVPPVSTFEDQGVAEGPGFDKWADDRAASQLHKLKPGMVQDRKTGKWYDPNKEFDKKMNSPEVMAQMKRMAQKESIEEDQLDEKWTKKYKDSINCSNPKGFSQKAHCAGKQKNESAIMKGLKL